MEQNASGIRSTNSSMKQSGGHNNSNKEKSNAPSLHKLVRQFKYEGRIIEALEEELEQSHDLKDTFEKDEERDFEYLTNKQFNADYQTDLTKNPL